MGESYRGTWRWIRVESLHINVSILLGVASILFLSSRLISIFKTILFCVAIILLIANHSFSIAICSTLAGLWILLVNKGKKFEIAFLILILFLVLLGTEQNANRRRRAYEHFFCYERSYQTEQLVRSLSETKLFGPCSASNLHLPGWCHDLAFADVMRKHGLILGILILILYGVLLTQLANAYIYGSDEVSSYALGAVVYFAILITVHIGVNMGILPPMGVSLPFCGRGGTAWAAYTFMIAGASPLGDAFKNGSLSAEDVRKILLKYLLILLFMALGFLVVAYMGKIHHDVKSLQCIKLDKNASNTGSIKNR